MGEGGQIYVNLEGREAQGTVASDEYMPLLERLKRELTEDVKAAVLFRNESCFGPLSPVGPDLFLHFARGDRRTDERVGFGRIEDTGRAKSSPLEGYSGLGYLSIAGSDFPAGGDLSEVSVLDIAPTVIDIMNLRAPYGVMAYELEGYSLLRDMRDSARAVQPDEGKEVKEEDKVRSRLEALGY
jgi:predicted AlkP superfamily phosphohydrolase/phosphomutase